MPPRRSPTASPTAPARPLVVSTDEELLDDVLRVLAAAGTEPQVATDGPALRRAHRDAALVLLGADALAGAAVRSLPRRPGVVVVAAEPLPPAAWAAAVELGAERVAVLPADEAWLVARAAGAVRSPVERGRLVVVGGSCGGAGASTLAAAFAATAAEEAGGALLVDADVWGGGLDLLLGAEDAEGLRWPGLTGIRGRVAGDALLAALPEVGGVHVLAASREDPEPLPPEALTAVVDAARSCGRPVVVDLPRPGSGGTALAEAALAEADLAVLVVPARLRAASAARLLVCGPPGGPVPWSAARLVVRPVPGGLSARDVAAVTGRPVAGELAHDRGCLTRGERGEPPSVGPRSPLGGLTRRLLGERDGRERAA
ncbi:secretion/DNA translocation related CpaE-like protein [Geodermatophilus tzadiensis]|uniref:Secretion/DNA translocation related CpaE-like protein n=1 Tax=Geodermatophilus tzadiensis TaxID=1137988 RepID=A0A2T0TBY3_9ACTN|nr:septum site-determining protein Ssd [Geodermatophilus tzadiensis]PRY43159.1 secretion/DNA translocation related CpaE-like protein [Geodermatophilus tzadiensis]